MAEQRVFFNTVTVSAAATALSIYDLVTDTALSYALPKNLPGQCVSMNFTANKDMTVGYGTVDASHGATLAANTPFSDSASGVSGNTIPISQFLFYAPNAGGDITVTVYLRFIG